jgi:hypothetical protein
MRRSSKLAAVLGSLSASVLLFAGQAAAQSGRATLDMFRPGQGPFQCRTMNIAGGTTLFVPVGGDANEKFNVAGWGNGTVSPTGLYNALLTQVCEEGIVVAAAATTNACSGSDVQASVQAAIAMAARPGNPLSGRLAENVKILTFGHSQGGAGAVNAALRLNAKFVINVEPDFRFTCSANGRLPADVRAFAPTGTADTLAPPAPNRNGLRRANGGQLIEATFRGVTHTTPNGPFGAPGAGDRDFRASIGAFAVATLRDDARAQAARTLFDGPNPGLQSLMGNSVTFFSVTGGQQ